MQLVVPFGLKGMDRRRLTDKVKRLMACVAARQDVARTGLRLDDVTVEETVGSWCSCGFLTLVTRRMSQWAWPFAHKVWDSNRGLSPRAGSLDRED